MLRLMLLVIPMPLREGSGLIKYFHTYTPAGVAHNLFHVWMHKFGFTQAWALSRDYSVPYAFGNSMGEIVKNFL